MFQGMLMTHWKLARWPLLFATLFAFAVPVLSVQGAGVLFGGNPDPFRTGQVLGGLEAWGTAYPFLASLVGMILGITAWLQDHRGKHVYALSLPIPRWRYALLRLGAGGVMLSAPVVAMALGAALAVAAATVPPGTAPHPVALTIRFGLAAAVAYAGFFTVSAASDHTARRVAAAFAGLIVLQIVLVALGLFDPLSFLGRVLVEWPGPLQIFTGRWMLIDV